MAAATHGDSVRHAFLTAGDAAVRLLGSEVVAARWASASALDGWTVGGLAGHLGRAVLTVSRYLGGAAPAADAVTVDAPGYMLEAIDDGDLHVDSALYTAIRARGDQEGAQGQQSLVEVVARELATSRRRLGRVPDRIAGATRIRVLDGITMTLDDYLATRVVELVVHLDDLAVSVDTDPAIPSQALSVATEVVVELARRRRGDLAVVHTMTRRERAPAGPLAL